MSFRRLCLMMTRVFGWLVPLGLRARAAARARSSLPWQTGSLHRNITPGRRQVPDDISGFEAAPSGISGPGVTLRHRDLVTTD